MTDHGARLRIAVLIVVPTVLFYGIRAAVDHMEWILLSFFIVPDPHLFPTAGEIAAIRAVPLLAATAATVGVVALLERWAFGPREARISGGVRPRTTRAATTAMIAAVLVAGYAFDLAAQRSDALSDSPKSFGSMDALASELGGPWLIARIARDRSLPMAKRLEAAKSLAFVDSRLDDVDAVVAEALASPDSGVRAAIPRVLYYLGERGRPAARALLDDPDEQVQLRTLETRVLNHDQAAVDRLEALMMSGTRAVRFAAYRAYLETVPWKTGRLQPTLQRLLAGPDEDLRLTAAGQLADIGDRSGYDVALAAVRQRSRVKEPPMTIERFEVALSTLGRMQDERAAPLLWTLAHCDALTKSERDTAAQALRRIYKQPPASWKMDDPPARYGLVDPRVARSRPEWVDGFCR